MLHGIFHRYAVGRSLAADFMANPVAAAHRLDFARARLYIDDKEAVGADDDGVKSAAHTDVYIHENLEGFGQSAEEIDIFRASLHRRFGASGAVSRAERGDGDGDAHEDVEGIGIRLEEDEAGEPEQEDDEADDGQEELRCLVLGSHSFCVMEVCHREDPFLGKINKKQGRKT